MNEPTHHLRASLEAIDFQRGSMLFKELTFIISNLKVTLGNDKIENNPKVAQHLKDLSSVIKRHTGMSILCDIIKKDANAFVFVPDASTSNPMTGNRGEKLYRGGVKSEQELFKGVVDIKKSMVSGIYSEVPFTLGIGELFLRQGNKYELTPEETAAIILHEAGHAFTFLEYMGQAVIGNLVFAEILRKIHEGYDPKSVQEVIKIAETKTGYKLKDIDLIVNKDEPFVIYNVIMQQSLERVRSDIGSPFYDNRAFEFSADQFAARHGAGQYIVTGLNKMYKGSSTPEYMSSGACLLLGLVDILDTVLRTSIAVVGIQVAAGVGAGGTAAASIMSILAISAGVTVVGFLLGLGFTTAILFFTKGDIYDDITNRYRAVYREIIAFSKIENLSMAERRKIIEDLKVIQETIDKLNKYNPSLDALKAYLAGVFTGQQAQLKFNRLIEQLANNRMFELANQLQVASARK